MKTYINAVRPAAICLLAFTLLCGVIYTGAVTGIAQLIFPEQANGSIITVTLKDGKQKEIGSKLLAQEFTKPEYLIGRPLGTSNLSAVSKDQQTLVEERIKWWHELDVTNNQAIPADLVTASGSGVDPNISPKAAEYQISRIAKARNISESTIKEIINKYTSGRFLGFWGEPSVNVLKVNLALDGLIT